MWNKIKWVPVVCYAIGLMGVGFVMKITKPVHDYFYYTKHLKRPSSGKSKGL